MPSSYPTGFDVMLDPGANLSGPPTHSDIEELQNDAIEAMQAELGLSPSGTAATVAARFTTGAILPAAAIIERSTTANGATAANQVAFSTVHMAMMRWTDTQWLFAERVPAYMAASYCEQWDANELSGTNWPFAALAAGTNTFPVSAVVGHPGIMRITSTSGTANSGGLQSKPNIGTTPITSDAGLRYRELFSLVAVATQNVHRIGFHDGVDQTAPVDGAFLEIINTTASFKTIANSAVTTNGTTGTVAADTWYTVHIWFPSSSTARCIVIADNGTVIMDVTNIANVPTGTARSFRAASLSYRTDTTLTALIDIDSIAMGYAAV